MASATRLLSYVGPYDWQAALTFLSRRAIEGVEQVADGTYCRTIRCGRSIGTLTVDHDDRASALVVSLSVEAATADEVIERVRRMFDLDADLQTINADLAGDPWMAGLVAARPALRVPGGWDGFEVAARSIIGQQVTVARARQLNGVLVDRCGTTLRGNQSGPLGRLFPTPRQVLDADLSAMGMPGARAATLKTVAAAAIGDPRLFERSGCIDDTIARLRGLRGIGDWTAHYIAMRACREPDAFPAGDVGLLRGAADRSGGRPTPAALLARAEAWRPWRAYAAHQLWAEDPASAAAHPRIRPQAPECRPHGQPS
ncbi:MAG TPA: AlkA N-terminal domain-containing protein [Vicinamibacterales bacterium]|nr:AlkA N-terminal domain-containing protein [Vicinamibacterales bacterium]